MDNRANFLFGEIIKKENSLKEKWNDLNGVSEDPSYNTFGNQHDRSLERRKYFAAYMNERDKKIPYNQSHLAKNAHRFEDSFRPLPQPTQRAPDNAPTNAHYPLYPASMVGPR